MSDSFSRIEGCRRPRNVILVVTEGDTERIFFDGLKQRGLNIEIRSERGKRTNARQLVEYCVERMKANELDVGEGDLAICVFDIDNNSKKDLEAALDLAEKNGIIVAVSNPCFELWYLLHFRDFDHHVTSYEIQRYLSKHIRKYDKTEDYRGILIPRRNEALIRAKRIAKRRGIRNIRDYADEKNNPCTSIHIAINAIERLVVQ